MRILVISGSLDPESRSYVLARHALQTLQGRGVEAEWIDLREMEVPLCDGTQNSKGGDVMRLREAIEVADGVLVAAPIYNFDVSAAIKNLVEQTGQAWTDKTVGFLCAAGGRASYMSVMAMANSLMLDFRCVIVPRFVYATDDDFSDQGTEALVISSDEVAERVDELAAEVVRLAGATA
jgi:FMN reductase